MTAQIVFNDGTPHIGSYDAGVLGSITLSNFDNTGVLGWEWELLDRPIGSAAVLSSATAAEPTFSTDVRGTYFVRLRTYVDAARTSLDGQDSKVYAVRLAGTYDWRVPAAGETREMDAQRGWATSREEAIRDTAAYLTGGLQSAYAAQPTVDLGGGILLVQEGGNTVMRFDGPSGRAQLGSGTELVPALGFAAEPSTGPWWAGAGELAFSTLGVERARFGVSNSTLSTHWLPDADGVRDLGFDAEVSPLWWRAAYVETVEALAVNTSTLDVAATATINEALLGAGSLANPSLLFWNSGFYAPSSGTLTFESEGVDVLDLSPSGGRLAGNWLPDADLTYSLGSASLRWNEVHAGDIFADSITLTTPVTLSHADLDDLVAPADDHTQYLLVSGTRAMSGSLLLASGSAASPGLTFDGDTTVGFMRGGAGQIGIVTSNTERWRFDGTTLYGLVNGVNIRQNLANGVFSIYGNITSATDDRFGVQITNVNNMSGASGSARHLLIENNVNQSGTAGYSVMDVVADEVGTGSGAKYLIHAKAGAGGTTSRWALMNDGQHRFSDGTAAAPAMTFLAQTNIGFYRSGTSGLTLAISGAAAWSWGQTRLTAVGSTSPDIGSSTSTTARLSIFGSQTSGVTDASLTLYNFFSWTGTAAGTQRGVKIQNTVNQVGSLSGFTALDIVTTETSLGSGTQSFISAKGGSAGTTEMFAVRNNGNIITSGTVDGRDVAADGALLDAHLIVNGGTFVADGDDFTEDPTTAWQFGAENDGSASWGGNLTAIGFPSVGAIVLDAATTAGSYVKTIRLGAGLSLDATTPMVQEWRFNVVASGVASDDECQWFIGFSIDPDLTKAIVVGAFWDDATSTRTWAIVLSNGGLTTQAVTLPALGGGTGYRIRLSVTPTGATLQAGVDNGALTTLGTLVAAIPDGVYGPFAMIEKDNGGGNRALLIDYVNWTGTRYASDPGAATGNEVTEIDLGGVVVDEVAFRTTNVDATITDADEVLLVNTGAGNRIVAGDVAATAAQTWVVKKITTDTNTVQFNPPPTHSIEGGAAGVSALFPGSAATDRPSWRLMFDGNTTWWFA